MGQPKRRTRVMSAVPRQSGAPRCARSAVNEMEHVHTTWPLAQSRKLYDSHTPLVAVPKLEASSKLKHICLKTLIGESGVG